MQPELLKRYAGPVPRYTSYPTAPHFSATINATTYAGWIDALPRDGKLSLYVHIPYCHELCWYCGCNTKATRRYEPVAKYLDVLLREIDSIAARLSSATRVTHIHWGGGSPNVLSPEHVARLSDRIRRGFRLGPDAEFAIEVDPRSADDRTIRAFAEAGVNRVSIGVQDFSPEVQRAINRLQSFELTRSVVGAFRSYGVGALNIDLVYGLPEQTTKRIRDTVTKVTALRPNRVAIFGYAHLPQRLKHQRLIDEATLPDATERAAQAMLAATILADAGYRRIGLDHFVLPNDPMARSQVHRNFQGYTDDEAPVLLGLGASAIGRLPQGYVQNATSVSEYARRIEADGLATARGHALTVDDAARAFAIERLMCDLRFPAPELRENFGATAEPIIAEAREFLAHERDGLIARDPHADDVFTITESGRLFVRSICAVFDSYLRTAPATIGSQGV
jgi:oxygen-independent coproporphyrinogen III oxidase